MGLCHSPVQNGHGPGVALCPVAQERANEVVSLRLRGGAGKPADVDGPVDCIGEKS